VVLWKGAVGRMADITTNEQKCRKKTVILDEFTFIVCYMSWSNLTPNF